MAKDFDRTLAAVRAIGQFVGKTFDENHPRLDARLPDGSRVCATMPPVTKQGVCVAIRRFFTEKLTMQQLLSFGSISEDAMRSVPAALREASYGLGARKRSTTLKVILPAAISGIVASFVLAISRGVGETMIVLMATGNTAVMDFSLFTGMRTLAANVAVEMPESEVGSTHFRMLFLSGLVLFLFTFFFNTVAEVVRSRLRRKYSSL